MTVTAQKAWFWIGVAALAIAVLWLSNDVLTPFVLGAILAYILDPVADWFGKYKIQRAVATLLSLAVFLSAFVGLFFLIAPIIQSQLTLLAQKVPEHLQQLIQIIAPYIDRWAQTLGATVDVNLQEIVGSHVSNALGILSKAILKVISGGSALLGFFSLVFIMPIVAFYLLKDWDTLVKKLDSFIPKPHLKSLRKLFKDIDTSLAGFLRGQALVCLFLGCFYAVGLHFIGIEFGVTVGFLTGIFAFVPYLGVFLGELVAVLLAIPHGWSVIVSVIIVFAVGQFIEGNFITPKLVGDRVGLHPVWIIFALLLGGTLLGFEGVLLAVPVAAVVGVLVRFALSKYQASGFYRA